MGKAGLAVCVGFVLGGTCVCVLVGGNGVFCLFFFSFSLMSRAVSGGMFSGVCGKYVC